MRQKNDTENMLILLDKSKLLSHCQYAVQLVTLFKAGGGKVMISETSNEDKWSEEISVRGAVEKPLPHISLICTTVSIYLFSLCLQVILFSCFQLL